MESVRSTGRTVLLLDAGDFITQAGFQSDKNSIQLKIATEFMLEGMNFLGYTCANVGEGDLTFGDKFLKDLSERFAVPLVSASLRLGEELAFPPVHIATAGPIKVGIVGVLSDNFTSYVLDHSDPGRPVVIGDPQAAMERGLELLSDKVNLRVLLVHAPIKQVRELLQAVPGYDIAISGHDTRFAPVDEPEVVNGTYLVQIGWEGKRIGRLDITVDPAGRITEIEGSSTALDSSWPSHPAMQDLHERYLARVGEALEEILAAYPVKPPPSGSRYVGSEVCRTCHENEWTSWRNTKHARAWRTLQGINRDYDPECFSCHTTGFGYEGGFRLYEQTPNLAGVQCESCHGAGGDHVDGLTPFAPVEESACLKCHVPLHSPDFDYSTYLPRVLHRTGE